jgi:hypothetical protein
MTSGPIEFLSESPAHEVPASEYGGADGLIQPSPHEMTASEVNSAMARAAMSNVVREDDVIVDPHTGLVADAG